MLRSRWRRVVLLFVAVTLAAAIAAGNRLAAAEKVFRAGAAVVDITPTEFPAIVSGGFLAREAAGVTSHLFSRALVLDDGSTRLAIVVVDILFMPRELIDRAKQQAHQATGIPVERMLVSATHTHLAPAVAGALGTDVDQRYAPKLPAWIAQSIEKAAAHLAAAEAGWAVAAAPDHTHCRRWIFRSDRMRPDPFGDLTVRAHMHPGYQNPDCVGPSGPVDSDLSLLAIRSREGRPLALLGNYSMHYFGDKPISADYFGLWCKGMAERIGAGDPQRAPVAILSQGTSGDQHWMDYSQPRKNISLEQYSEAVAQIAWEAFRGIRYRPDISLAMAQRALRLERRVPDEGRLAWARQIEAARGSRPPQNQREVYAREQVYLHDEPARELLLQAVRVGELGITAIPNEVFGITGLKLKAQSPLVPTLNIELANGCEGYIPPPEQHKLGGYTTWPARSAGLEVQAEPKIVEAVLGLLEQVAGRPRRTPADVHGPYARAVLAANPLAYWRLSEFQGVQAHDATGHAHHGTLEGGFALYLEGPPAPGFCGGQQVNRCVQLAGGRLSTLVDRLPDAYSAELWCRNALPADAHAVTGYLFSRAADEVSPGTPGDQLGIGGRDAAPGRLIFHGAAQPPAAAPLAGKTELQRDTWYHVVLVRQGRQVRVYLNGNRTPEIEGQSPLQGPTEQVRVFVGGRSDNVANLEGRLDEVALYDRALTADEIAAHYAASQP